MNKILWIVPLLALAACETPEQRALTGAATGAAVGAMVSSDKDRTKGALIGGGAGLLAATVIGQSANGQCIYRRSDGSTYTAPC